MDDARWVSGVDGCRFGWLAVDVLFQGGRILEKKVRLERDLDGVVNGGPAPEMVALDIPIGLLEEREPGGRICDRLTRKELGRPRGSSVFSPPVRPLLQKETWEEVRGKGLSLQAFHIMGKIRDVDTWMNPARQERVIEGHPELVFARLNGAPMTHNKKRSAGRKERMTVLEKIFPDIATWAMEKHFARKDAARDDLLDACVLAELARARLQDRAQCLPPNRPCDQQGLEMVIWTLPQGG